MQFYNEHLKLRKVVFK